MRGAGQRHSESRLLAFIADELERHIGRDGGIQAACQALQRLGSALVVSAGATAGDAAPRVTVLEVADDVPQWNDEDAEILPSLGIARDASPFSDGAPLQSGRREPG